MSSYSKMSRIISIAIFLFIIAGTLWMLFLPFPKGGWPEVSEATKRKNLDMLVADAQHQVSEKNYTSVLKSVEIITKHYPDSAPAQQYKSLIPRLSGLAEKQAMQDKWTYSKTGGGNMEITQGALVEESDVERKKMVLIVQTGSVKEANNVYLQFENKNEVPFQETLAKVQPIGQKESFVKLFPVEGNEGVFQFSDASAAFAWVRQKEKIKLLWPNQSESSTFDLRGVDLEKLNL